jgi:hypothetical protein
MKTEHLEKACQTSDALLGELRLAQQENPADSAMIFSLVEEALGLDAKICVTLAAAVQARTAAKKMKGHKYENYS